MKKFIVMILTVTTFFLGLGSLAGEVGAKFKSDERALELIRQARQAIGGEANIKNVRSLTIVGTATQTLEMDGAQRAEQGDLEINLSFPNQYGKMLKFGKGEDGIAKEDVKVFVMKKSEEGELLDKTASEDGKQTFTIRKKLDGVGEKVITDSNEDVLKSTDSKRILLDKDVRGFGGYRQNELLRTTLSLLMTAPEGQEISYTYAGEGNVDGFSCDIVEAQSNGSSIKLYLDKSSHLPRMMTYQGVKPFMIKINKDGLKKEGEDKKTKVFTRQAMPKPETAEFQVKFSDYRAVNGVQLPFHWTQTVGGQADQTVDIVSYEINPANITEKFKNQKTFLRTEKPQ